MRAVPHPDRRDTPPPPVPISFSTDVFTLPEHLLPLLTDSRPCSFVLLWEFGTFRGGVIVSVSAIATQQLFGGFRGFPYLKIEEKENENNQEEASSEGEEKVPLLTLWAGGDVLRVSTAHN